MNTSSIKTLRIQNLFTQKQVYDGLCPEATFSRIENKDMNMEFILLEALAGRLGADPTLFDPCISGDDYQLLEERNAILADITAERFESAKIRLASYEDTMPKRPLHRQFVLYQRARLRCSNQVKEKFLLQAWSLTKKTNKIQESELYTPTEIRILLALIHIRSSFWNMDHIMHQLEILRNKIDRLFTDHLLDELRNACLWELLCQGKDVWDTYTLLEKTDDAIRALSPQQSFRHAIHLHIFKAKVLARYLETPGDHAVEREQFIRECRMVYFSFDCQEQAWKREQIAAYCAKKTGTDIRD